jgi:hypothetical protein
MRVGLIRKFHRETLPYFNVGIFSHVNKMALEGGPKEKVEPMESIVLFFL